MSPGGSTALYDAIIEGLNVLNNGDAIHGVHDYAFLGCEGLEEVTDSRLTRKTSAYYKQLYRFPTSISVSGMLPILEGQLLLEINSFGNPYPFVSRQIQSFITEFLQTQEQFRYLIDEYRLQPFTINVLDKRRTMLEKTVSLLRFSFAGDINELAAKIRHFYDLYFLVQDRECQQYLHSGLFRTELAELYAHDQDSFDQPEGWSHQPYCNSPLLTNFGAVWQQLKNTYETQIPPLAYIKPIPAADRAAQAFQQINMVLQ